MSGHSKWATIKRKKGMIDADRGKIFQKLAKEIYMAAKSGDKNPENNATLRMVIEKARGENMPKDKIQGAIDKAKGSSNSESYETIRYEGYGPHGIAIMVDCLTDNRNRTAMLVRSTFTKKGGNLGTDGSVSYLFERKGVIILPKTYPEDKVMDIAILNDALDVINDEEGYTIYTRSDNFIKVKEALEKAEINKFITSEVTYIASNEIVLDEEASTKVMNLIEALDEIEDVQNVYSNLG